MTVRKMRRKPRSPVRKRTAFAAQQIRKQRDPAGKDAHRLLQLMISGSVFVLLVAVKLLLPEEMAQVSGPISGALEQNMDITGVFSVVGRAFSGEHDGVGDSLSDLYQAVFHPDTAATGTTIVFVTPVDPLGPLRAFADGSGTSSGWLPSFAAAAQPDAEQVSSAGASWILYSGENLPENVELGQAVLGFDYCAPVSGTLSSAFGYRQDPLGDDDRFHYGLDLTAETGTPIMAFADGTVTAVGESSSYGKYLILAHSDDCTTLYAHCSTISVRSGQAVSLGDAIAEVGETGQATGPHLHFELQRAGVYLNPVYYVA